MRFFLVFCLSAVFMAPVAVRANCMAGGCHSGIAGLRYMHGPVGAEFAGVKGCEVCHESAGRACSARKGGAWRLKKGRICGTCHGAGTSTVHSSSRKKCLSCHNPHGSATSPAMLRNR